MEEVRHAIKEAASKSAPGPSGQTIEFNKYILAEIPYIITKALNEIPFYTTKLSVS